MVNNLSIFEMVLNRRIIPILSTSKQNSYIFVLDSFLKWDPLFPFRLSKNGGILHNVIYNGVLFEELEIPFLGNSISDSNL